MSKVGRVRVYKVSNPALPKRSFILSIPWAQRIIYDPSICGLKLEDLAKKCSEEFLRVAWELVPLFRRLRNFQIAELVVLRGSLGYHFDQAYRAVFGRYLPRCFVGAKRYRISGGEFGANIFYTNFDSLPSRGLLFTGDTIATGVSLSQTLAVTRSELRNRDYDISALLVFTIAGSFRGCSRLLEWEERYREWWPNFRVYLFACEALFGLAPNGTDLLFAHPEAILPAETKQRVIRRYGDLDSGYLPSRICAIFDWGDRNFKPDRHLEDLIKFCREHLRRTREPQARRVLQKLVSKAKTELKNIRGRNQLYKPK